MEDESKPTTQFTVDLGKMALTDEQIAAIQNDITKTVAAHVKKLGAKDDASAKAPDFRFNRFGSFRSFGSII